jgi:hypothetical protein
MGDRQVFSVADRIQKDYRPSYLPSSRDHKRPPRQRRRPYDATEQAIKLLEKLRMEYLPREKGGSTQDYGNRRGILWP